MADKKLIAREPTPEMIEAFRLSLPTSTSRRITSSAAAATLRAAWDAAPHQDDSLSVEELIDELADTPVAGEDPAAHYGPTDELIIHARAARDSKVYPPSSDYISRIPTGPAMGDSANYAPRGEVRPRGSVSDGQEAVDRLEHFVRGHPHAYPGLLREGRSAHIKSDIRQLLAALSAPPLNAEGMAERARELLAEAFGDMELDRRHFLADTQPKTVLTSVALRAIQRALASTAGADEEEPLPLATIEGLLSEIASISPQDLATMRDAALGDLAAFGQETGQYDAAAEREPMTKEEWATPSQADRDAAADWYARQFGDTNMTAMREGGDDENQLVQVALAHRLTGYREGMRRAQELIRAVHNILDAIGAEIKEPGNGQ